MEGVSQILPEASAFLPQDRLVDFVFDDFVQATTIGIGGLIPLNPMDAFSKLTPEQAVSLGKTYLDLLDKASAGGGFEVADPVGFESGKSLFRVGRHAILGAVSSKAGEKATLELDPVPLAAGLDTLVNEVVETRKKLYALSPEQVDSIVTRTLHR